ncbi:hypothetical protein PINS_up008182 [Pythium insidiosum]|nr:hypothetical protein PINS_up008182 [Pythium insidiosum]
MDLRVVDRHLEFLQQESSDMKALVESMVASNARWIEALAGCGLAPRTSTSLSKAEPSVVSPPVSPVIVPVVTPDDSLRSMTEALNALQAKYDALLGEHSRVLEHRTLLETKLRQEMLLNQELRAHVDQLTQYTESLIVGDDFSTAATSTTPAMQPSLTDDEDPALDNRHLVDAGNQALHDCSCPPPTPELLTPASLGPTKRFEPEDWLLPGDDSLSAADANQAVDENASPPPTLSRLWCVSPSPVGVLTAKTRVPSLSLDDELLHTSNQTEDEEDTGRALRGQPDDDAVVGCSVERDGRGRSSDKRAIVERRHGQRDESPLPASPTSSDVRRSRPPSPQPASLLTMSPRSLFEQFRHLQ